MLESSTSEALNLFLIEANVALANLLRLLTSSRQGEPYCLKGAAANSCPTQPIDCYSGGRFQVGVSIKSNRTDCD
jgi:hypothetical protein